MALLRDEKKKRRSAENEEQKYLKNKYKSIKCKTLKIIRNNE